MHLAFFHAPRCGVRHGKAPVAGRIASAAGRDDPRPGHRSASPNGAAWPAVARAAVAALILLVLGPGAVAGQVIRGRVIDAQTGAGVPLARVVVTGLGQRYTGRMFTGADGRFSFPLRRGGSFRVRVTRTGYEETRTRPVTVGPDETVDVNVRVAAVAHRLEPVTVTGRPRRLRVAGVFNEVSEFPYTRVIALGQRGQVRVRGWFPVPGFCHHLSGNADRAGSVITLTVQARAPREPCEAGTGSFFYDVAVRRLPPGLYTLRVLHAFQDAGAPPSTVLDTAVTIR